MSKYRINTKTIYTSQNTQHTSIRSMRREIKRSNPKGVDNHIPTDRQLATTRAYRAIKAYRKARRYADTIEVSWTGEITPAWTAYVIRYNTATHLETTATNLFRLLSQHYSSYSCRNVAFDTYGDLHVDGDWVADLDGGAEDTCIPCIRKLLLAGTADPSGVWGIYVYIGEPEYTVECSECGVELYHVDEVSDDYDTSDMDDDVLIGVDR